MGGYGGASGVAYVIKRHATGKTLLSIGRSLSCSHSQHYITRTETKMWPSNLDELNL